jgi:hypothetical protein
MYIYHAISDHVRIVYRILAGPYNKNRHSEDRIRDGRIIIKLTMEVRIVIMKM